MDLTKNICRTCLNESKTMTTNIQDPVEHESLNVKLVDILVFLNCLENDDEENWPRKICDKCVATALTAYNFKKACLKSNSTLTQLLKVTPAQTYEDTHIDAIDINVVYQDHGYDSFFNQLHDENSSDIKELTPLPPVSEITSTEQPLRKEGDKQFPCTICSKSFTRMSGLKGHMARHSNIHKYLCQKCGKPFYSASGLQQHMKSHRKVGQFKCGFCSKHYKSRQSLKEHFRVAHSSNSHSFVCTLCGKGFTAKSTLRMHMQVHDLGKQYACPECPKSYTRPLYLKMHRLTHSGVERPRPFSCSYENCDRTFTTKQSLNVHIAHVHKIERPYCCRICSRGFATMSALKLHTETHTVRDYTCNICGKELNTKKLLKKHIAEHKDKTEDMILEMVINNNFFDHIY